VAVPVSYADRLTGVVRTVSCRGHAFDEELVCSCGVTWFEHQNAPVRCRVGAQRCKRAQPATPPPAKASD
jgi:hypothetical protein